MSTSTCPHCGGPIAPNVSRCQYCGADIAVESSGITTAKWIAIKDKLPPPSSNDLNKSNYMLVCFCKDGGHFIDKEEGVEGNYYSVSVFSAYYDFKSKKWSNDFYGKKIQPLFVSHWMELPTIGSSDWIPSVLRTPMQEGDSEGYSTAVLICNKSGAYESSIIAAHIDLTEKKWSGGGIYCFVDDLAVIEATKTVTVSHWMPLPDAPLD